MNSIKRSRKNYLFDKIVGIVLSIIQPIIGLLFSIRYIDKKWFQIVIIIFCTFFGYTMYVEDPLYDSSRYRDFFLEVYIVKESYLIFILDQIRNIYVQDYYESSLAFFISRFTSDYQIYFAFLGFIYGIIYAKNIYLISSFVSKNKLFSILLLFSIVSLYGPWAINGARFGTATQLFLYVFIIYFLYNKKINLFLLLLLPLIHFSFILLIFIFVIYLLFKKIIVRFQSVLLLIFISSLLLEFFITNAVNNLIHYFPPFLANKIIAYTSIDAINEFNSEQVDLSFLAKLSDYATKAYFLIAYIYIYFLRKKYRNTMEKLDISLIDFFLYFASVFSLLAFLPSFSRYINITLIVSFIVFLRLIKNYNFLENLNNRFRLGFLLVLSCIFIARSIRYGVLFLGEDFYKSSPLFIFFNH